MALFDKIPIAFFNITQVFIRNSFTHAHAHTHTHTHNVTVMQIIHMLAPCHLNHNNQAHITIIISAVTFNYTVQQEPAFIITSSFLCACSMLPHVY